MGADATESALRALRYRDLSAHELDRRLADQGFSSDARELALATLGRTGLIDDARFARARAAALAARGSGDELIRHRLREAGVSADVADGAVADLEPEVERARRIVARRGTSPRTARYLYARGFSADAVASVVATPAGGELR
jgi:regulatory protein